MNVLEYLVPLSREGDGPGHLSALTATFTTLSETDILFWVGELWWPTITLSVFPTPHEIVFAFRSFFTVSRMLYPSNDTSPNLSPIDAPVQLLVHKSAYGDVLSADEIKTVTNFGTWFFVIWGPYNALNGLA